MVGKDNLIHLPELSMSYPSLRKYLSELYNISINTMAESKKVKELLDKANYLFYNHISNRGNLDYSEKEYGYLVEAIEDVEVGYFKDESVDSGYAERLRDEGFSLTEQEAIQTLELRIKNIEEEVGPVKYARGGFVSKGEMVWNQWLSSKRADFLYKHFTPEITPRGQEILVGKTWNFLPRNVKNKLQSEYANVEEYSNGGGVGGGGQVGTVWIVMAQTKQGLLLSERFGTPITNEEIYDYYRKQGYEVIDSKVLMVKNSSVLDTFKDAVADLVMEKYNEKVDWDSSVLPYSVVGDKMIFQKCFVQTNKGNEYEISPNDLISSDYGNSGEFANGGGVGEYAESKFDSSVAKLKEYIKKYPYIWTKNNKEYVPIEGWQFAGLILGYSTRVTEVTPTANGYMAKAEVINGDGQVVCSGFGLVDKSESKWSGKPEYQLVGFAQTRAVSRALRNCLSWMVKAAGFSTTPAEEMYGVTPEKRGKMSSYRTFMPPMQSSKSEDTGFIFDRPEYQKAAPSAPESPVSTTQKENAEEIEETLRQMKAKAMANKIVIKSPDFMKEIDKALVGTDTDLQLSILKSAVMYMDENNIILQTPRYMSKLRKVANQGPF